MNSEEKKRTREQLETATGKELHIFERSKKIIRSPEQNIAKIERIISASAPTTTMEEVKEMFEKLMLEFNRNSAEIKREVKDIKDTTIELKHEMQEMKNMFAAKEIMWEGEKQELEKRIAALEEQGEKIEKRQRKNNIIVKGVKTSDSNVREDLEKFFEKELQVKIRLIRAFKIKSTKLETVVAEVESWEKKQEIMNRKVRLGEKKIYIDNDLTIEERRVQEEIRKVAKTEREAGKRVKVGYKKIIINGKKYEWNGKKMVIEENVKTKN